jgi:hypothetical protein
MADVSKDDAELLFRWASSSLGIANENSSRLFRKNFVLCLIHALAADKVSLLDKAMKACPAFKIVVQVARQLCLKLCSARFPYRLHWQLYSAASGKVHLHTPALSI